MKDSYTKNEIKKVIILVNIGLGIGCLALGLVNSAAVLIAVGCFNLFAAAVMYNGMDE